MVFVGRTRKRSETHFDDGFNRQRRTFQTVFAVEDEQLHSFKGVAECGFILIIEKAWNDLENELLISID